MSKFIITFLCISFFFAGMTYLAINDIACSLIILIISLAYFFLFALPLIKKYYTKKNRFHECYRFINSFLISVNIKGSILAGFDAIKNGASEELLAILSGIENLTEKEKLKYLENYFPFHVYSIFLSCIFVWMDEGGNLLNYTQQLTGETRNVEEYLLNVERINKEKIFEFAILWIISILIIVVLRFALSQFYGFISKLTFYKLGVVGFFLIILISIHIVLAKACNLKIKGWDFDGKFKKNN